LSRYAGAVVVAALLLLGGVSSAPVAQAGGDPALVPPQSHAFGRSLGEWTAAWWRWAVSIPSDRSPLVDATGANCAQGQSGKVRFLAGTTGGSATRTCTIPTGTAILIPVFNAEWSAAEAAASGNGCFIPVPTGGTSEAALRACARAQVSHATTLEASIDGVPITDLAQPRADSPLFTFTAVANNPFGLPAVQTQAVSDGYWLLLHPLPPGKHTIHVHGVASFPELNNFTFETEVTYTLTIAPR